MPSAKAFGDAQEAVRAAYALVTTTETDLVTAANTQAGLEKTWL